MPPTAASPADLGSQAVELGEPVMLVLHALCDRPRARSVKSNEARGFNSTPSHCGFRFGAGVCMAEGAHPDTGDSGS